MKKKIKEEERIDMEIEINLALHENNQEAFLDELERILVKYGVNKKEWFYKWQ